MLSCLQLTESHVGTEGARRIFESAKPMPRSVRKLGCTLDGLDHHFWMAGDAGLKEGFGGFARGEDIHFPAGLFSIRRLAFYLRQYGLRRRFRSVDQRAARLKRQWRKSAAPSVRLDSDLIGLGTPECARIVAATDLVSEKLTRVVRRRGCELHWSWGDSRSWRVILAILTEAELSMIVSGDALAGLGGEVTRTIKTVVDLDEAFELYLELDSDERVNASEGWFLRLKSDPQPGRGFTFDGSGQRSPAD